MVRYYSNLLSILLDLIQIFHHRPTAMEKMGSLVTKRRKKRKKRKTRSENHPQKEAEASPKEVAYV